MKKKSISQVITKSGIVEISNPKKIYWPDDAITKGQLIDYYSAIADTVLPYLKNRPMSLHRYPNGIQQSSFYQKNTSSLNLPPFVKTVQVYSASTQKQLDFIVCNNTATMLYMINLGCIELNPWNSRITKMDHPDYLVLDLDPGEIDFKYVTRTARVIKNICDELKITSYCKTSGATGLHIYIPMHALYSFEEVRQAAELLAQELHLRTSEFTSIERSLSKRRNKIYIDYLQNSRGQTVASVFSVRPKPGATVSTPLHWDEVNDKLDPGRFNIRTILKSIKERDLIFQPVLKERNKLQKISGRLN